VSVDTTLLGQITANTMEKIADLFDGETFHIRTVALVVEVDSPEAGKLVIECSDDRPWVLGALLNEAWESVNRMRQEAYDRLDDNDE
jgi:hypothetical protein